MTSNFFRHYTAAGRKVAMAQKSQDLTIDGVKVTDFPPPYQIDKLGGGVHPLPQ